MFLFLVLPAALALGFVLGRMWQIRQEMRQDGWVDMDSAQGALAITPARILWGAVILYASSASLPRPALHRPRWRHGQR
jgi:hypothetical protein